MTTQFLKVTKSNYNVHKVTPKSESEAKTEACVGRILVIKLIDANLELLIYRHFVLIATLRIQYSF